MELYQLLYMIPLALVAFVASICVPIFLANGMNKLVGRFVKNNDALLEKVKSFNEGIVVFIFIVGGVLASIYFQ